MNTELQEKFKKCIIERLKHNRIDISDTKAVLTNIKNLARGFVELEGIDLKYTDSLVRSSVRQILEFSETEPAQRCFAELYKAKSEVERANDELNKAYVGAGKAEAKYRKACADFLESEKRT